MYKSSDYVTILIPLLINLLSSSISCESLRHQPIEVEQEYHSHLVQPELVRIFEDCHKNSSTFDPCIKTAFNELRVYFQTGEYWVNYFPVKSRNEIGSFVEQKLNINAFDLSCTQCMILIEIRNWCSIYFTNKRFSRSSYCTVWSTSFATRKFILFNFYYQQCISKIALIGLDIVQSAAAFIRVPTDCLMNLISQVEQRRGLTFGKGSGYRLILRHVSELGWTNSKVTKYR